MFDGKYLDWNQKRIKAIIDYYGYPFMHGKKVLDVGCGYADVGGALYRLGAEVTALDARQEHLKIVSKKFPGIKTIKSDMDGNWPFQKDKFDLILNLDLICHLSNFEAHLRSVCNSTTHLVLETAVCDSIDPYKVVFVPESKNSYDQSANGQGCRPSAAAIERILKECGFTFKRHDNPKFNSGTYTYDWRAVNNESLDINHRRIWFAVKTHHVQQVKLVQNANLLSNEAIQSSNLPANSLVNPKLANPFMGATPNKKIHAALCISGHLRTFLDNYKSVKEHILDKMDVDVFIHTWDILGLSYRHTDASLHVTETRNLADTINNLYQPKKLVIEKSRTFPVTPLMHQKLRDHRDISGILSMFYKVEACNSLKAQYEEENGFKYECVIRFRGDLWVEQPIPVSENTAMQHVYLPVFGNFGGACDQFAFGPSDLMDKYSSLYSNIEKHLHAGAIMNPEYLLLYHLEAEHIPLAKVNFKYVIKRANGLVQDNMLLERAIGFRR